MRASIGHLILSALAISGAPALAEAAPQSPPAPAIPDADMAVTKSVTAEGVVYSYKVTSRHPSAYSGLVMVGYSAASEEATLETLPIAVRAPPGWTGAMDQAEAAREMVVVWHLPDDADQETVTRDGIAPGATKTGFEVVLPRQAPEYLTAPYTVYFSDITNSVGLVTSSGEEIGPEVSQRISSAPFEAVLQVGGLPTGPHTIAAIAYVDAGYSFGTSSPVAINVARP